MSPNKIILAPSILACDNTNLISSIRVVENYGLTWLHLDIMDGNFVPNISFGPQLVADIRKRTDLFLDTHLMISHPENFIEKFLSAGANLITIHQEISGNTKDIIKEIKKSGKQAGIAINPETSVENILPIVETIDLALVMSVQPGFGGQKFQPHALEKIKILQKFRADHNLNFRIEVDGGIKPEILHEIISCGADTIVAGTAFFSAPQQFCESDIIYRKKKDVYKNTSLLN